MRNSFSLSDSQDYQDSQDSFDSEDSLGLKIEDVNRLEPIVINPYKQPDGIFYEAGPEIDFVSETFSDKIPIETPFRPINTNMSNRVDMNRVDYTPKNVERLSFEPKKYKKLKKSKTRSKNNAKKSKPKIRSKNKKFKPKK